MAAAIACSPRLARSTRQLVVCRVFSSTIRNGGAASASTPSESTSTTTTTSTAKTQQQSSLQDEIHVLWEQASGDAELRLLKNQVTEASADFDAAVRSVTQQRRVVEACQKQHEEAYQRHASLLMRREQWTPEEAAMFVEITSQEVKARHALHEAREELHTYEERASSLQQTFMDALRHKYQEEQAWQDRWRVLGTFGTWALIGLNSLVFLASQVLFYRREARRLVDIENLIKKNMTVNANDTVVIEKQLVGNANEDIQEESSSDLDEQEETETIPETESESDALDNDRPWRTKLKHLQQELVDNLHAPSAAAGAVASTTVCVIVGVLLSRR